MRVFRLSVSIPELIPILLVTLIGAVSGLAADKPPATGLEGVYDGEIEVTFVRRDTIPLQFSLTLTGETENVQTEEGAFEERQVIDGAMVIDDEGGPYAFSKVTYNLDTSEIDLRYDRQRLTSGPHNASFRLVGTIGENGEINGRAISGIDGPIGKFRVVKTEGKALIPRKKYLGVWPGIARITPYGPTRDFELNVGASGTVVKNPPNFEFEFSPGKTAQIVYDHVEMRFTEVVTDYLRHRLFFSDVDPAGKRILSAEGQMDLVRGSMRGILAGAYRGKSADFAVSLPYPTRFMRRHHPEICRPRKGK